MADSTDEKPAGEEAGLSGLQQAYTAFIVHTQQCAVCRGTGIDCADAAALKTAWREARAAA
ncbi:hypothetical protein [Streptomyces flavidovirens]|uniref:hypothetical protein n=1 Tax=Streptomyces flavidovirens TaxID=67298 RepID=UPI0036BEB4DC